MTASAQRAPNRVAQITGSRWLPTAGAIAITLAAAAFLLFVGRGTTFYLDDWAYLVQRASDINSSTLFASQNGNWATTQVLVYRALAELFGIGSYLPWRLTSLAIHLGCCALVYVLARRRLGPWWALVPLALVLVSRGWETLLWPFQMGQLLTILCWLGALLLLDRRDWRGDLPASLLLVVALASSSFGPPLVLAVGVEFVLSRWRALWVLIAPAAAYLWWHVKYNAALPSPGSTDPDVIPFVLRLTWDIMPSGPAAVLGTSFAVGKALLLLLAALTVLRIVLERRVPARLVGLLVAYVAYWLLVAWARSETGDLGHSPRYVDLATLLFVLACVELVAGLRPERWPAWARRPLDALRGRPALGPILFAVVVLIAARGVVLTSDNMKTGAGTSFRVWGQRMLAQQAALGIGRNQLQPLSPFYLETAGSFALAMPIGSIEEVAKRWGGDLYPSEASLRERPMDARRFADQALARAEAATVLDEPPATTLPNTGAPVRVVSTNARVTRDGGCLRWSEPQGVGVRVAVPATGLRVRNLAATGDMTSALMRWGDRPLQPDTIVAPGASATVRPRPDRSRQPWQLEVGGTSGEICSS